MFQRRFHTRAREAAVLLALAWYASGCEPPTDPQLPPADAGVESLPQGRLAAPAGPSFEAMGNGAPLGNADVYATTVDVPLAIEAPGLKMNDLDPDGDDFSLASFTQPAHGRIVRIVTSGAFTYESGAGFTGPDAFTYTLRDALGNISDPVNVTIEVLPDPNRAPTTLSDAFGTVMDTPLAVEAPGLIGNDLDLDGDDFVFASFTQPSNGRLTRAVTSGTFTYAPDPGFTGTDAFTYIARDEHGAPSAATAVTIEVRLPGGEVPVGYPDVYATTLDVPLAIEAPGLKMNDLDPDGDDFVLSSFTQPSNGRITRIVTSGTFTYEPAPGFAGSDGFTYTLRDAEGNYSDPIEVTIEVLPDPNRPPTALPETFSTFVGVPLAVEAPGLISNDLDLDGDAFVFNSFTQPSNGRITRAVTSGAFTYEPAVGFAGTDVFTYMSRDEHGAYSESATVTVEVLPPPDRTPPDIAVPTDRLVLHPPNHGYRTLAMADLVEAVTDEGDPGLTRDDVFVTRVTSDEPDDADDDGRTIDDIVIGAACRSVDLRAERIGTGNGRVYVVELAVADASGNVATATVEVEVRTGASTAAVKDAPASLVASPCYSP